MVSPWELVLSSCGIFLLFILYDVDLLPLCLVNETSTYLYLAGHFVYIKT